MKQLLNTFSHEKDPEIQLYILEARIDHAINTILLSSHNNTAEIFDSLYKGIKSHLDREDVLYHWARFIWLYRNHSSTKNPEPLILINQIIEKGRNSNHPGLSHMIGNFILTKQLFTDTTQEENKQAIELVLWRYGSSNVPEMQPLIAHATALSIPYRENIEEQKHQANLLWERWSDSSEASIQNSLLYGMGYLVSSYQKQGMEKEAVAIIETIIEKLNLSPHQYTLYQLLDYYEQLIEFEIKINNIDKALAICDEMEVIYKQLPEEKFRDHAANIITLNRIKILTSSKDIKGIFDFYKKHFTIMSKNHSKAEIIF